MSRTIKEIHKRCITRGECKLWTGGTTSRGTPAMFDREKHKLRKEKGNGGTQRSGRAIVWRLKTGSLPSGRIFMTCGNSLCLNVAHMVDLSQAEVNRANWQKGAYATIVRKVSQGQNARKNAKINSAQAATIRAEMAAVSAKVKGQRSKERAAKVRELAAAYGVGETIIRQIGYGRLWKAPQAAAQASVFAWAQAANEERKAA